MSERPSVLVVDDDDDIREAILELLLGEGYVVEGASSGEDALSALVKSPLPSVMLLDLLMPGLSGFDVLQRLRSNELTTRLPVLVVSANRDIAQARAAGANDILSKPFDVTHLLKLVARLARSLSPGTRDAGDDASCVPALCAT